MTKKNNDQHPDSNKKNEAAENSENANAAIQAKTSIKNAHAVGNGTTGKHDGEHSALTWEDQTNHLEGGDQY